MTPSIEGKSSPKIPLLLDEQVKKSDVKLTRDIEELAPLGKGEEAR